MTYSGNNTLIIAGMGKSGLSVADYLAGAVVEYECCDDNNKQYSACADVLNGYEGYVIKSPGMPVDNLPEYNADNLINDIELFLRLSKKPVIMVTGTNGKSTVVTLIEHILSVCDVNAIACGNNGVPVMQAYSSKADIYILELSSYQLENISSFSSLGSVVLNVGVDHVDRYHDMNEYESIKQKIYTSSLASVYPVLETGEIDFHGSAQGYVVSSSDGDVKYSLVADEIHRNDQPYCTISAVGLTGAHNHVNVCAALCLIDGLRFEKDDVVRALRSFKGLPHRMEIVCEDNQGRQWINDSKSTNVHSLKAALSFRSVPVCLIMGGRGKGEDYSQVFEEFNHIIGKLVVYGEEADVISSQASSILHQTKVDVVSEAVIVASQYPGDVLFSPACASFDQYRDFNERGDDFKQQVRKVVLC